MSKATGGQSMCHQMIMGAGKTTVVAPTLGLLLADGRRLVMEVRRRGDMAGGWSAVDRRARRLFGAGRRKVLVGGRTSLPTACLPRRGWPEFDLNLASRAVGVCADLSGHLLLTLVVAFARLIGLAVRSGGARSSPGLLLQRDAVRLQCHAQQAGLRLQVRPLHGGYACHS